MKFGRRRFLPLLIDTLFCLFAFSLLGEMQSDLSAWYVYRLTGMLFFEPFLIAFVVTLLCFVLQRGVRKRTAFAPAVYALTYVPSATLLSLAVCYPFTSCTWAGIALILIGWTLFFTVRQRPFATLFLPNLLSLLLLFLGIAFSANTDDVLHYELRTQRLLLEGKPDEALRVGERSLATSPLLNSLRVYALIQRGELGNKLFFYPQRGGSRSLFPTVAEAERLLFPLDSLEAMRSHSDYQLCALLLDRQLDRFVSKLSSVGTPADKLPLAFQEALILYAHLRTRPRLVYRNTVIEANYADFRQMQALYATQTLRANHTYRLYAHTYWWYYGYGRIWETKEGSRQGQNDAGPSNPVSSTFGRFR